MIHVSSYVETKCFWRENRFFEIELEKGNASVVRSSELQYAQDYSCSPDFGRVSIVHIPHQPAT